MEKYYKENIDTVMLALDTKVTGLTSADVAERLEKYGPNQLEEAKPKSTIQIFIEQFKDLLVLILIVAAGISIVSGHLESAVVIFAVIIINAILGTVQYVKAEQSLKSLKMLSAPKAKVFRDEHLIEVAGSDIVPGDVMSVEAGDMISADARIISVFSLQVNESALTGESVSVEKISEIIEKEDIALGDQKNMLFSSSLASYGRATAVVVGTGMNTEIGKIAGLLNDTKEGKTPLQVSLDKFSARLSVIIIIICAIVFGLSAYRGMPILDSLMFAVALAVAAIPEALSSIVTIVLALGTQKMAKENAIVKKIKAVEGLGCVSIICSDKTGTLTQNKMTVTKIYTDNTVTEASDVDMSNHFQSQVIESAVLCNDSNVEDGKEIGDPTEVALVNIYENMASGNEEYLLREKYKRVQEIPFDSDRKLMSTAHDFGGKYLMITKGAVDVLIDRVTHIALSEGLPEITEEDKNRIKERNVDFSKNGLRVLAFGFKELEENRPLNLEDEKGLTFLGLTAMIDPPRAESAAAVADCKRAGIKAIMITGDHKITASSIARQIGILNDGDLAIEGVELEKMTDEELFSKLEDISVYARVSPSHKIRIVQAWQKKGHIVAMTGDGVNDAPALKKADIGIAMGITGTEVSKDAASMILIDDNFATIIKSVANGRNIYSNIKNSIKFLLSGNMSGILAVLYTSILALPVPFAAVQLLFINLVTDSLPAVAIGIEKAASDLLSEKPRDSKEGILTKEYMKEIGSQGLLIAIFTIIAYYIGMNATNLAIGVVYTAAGYASTMAFGTLCLARLFHGFNCRGKKSIFKLGITSNMASIYAFLAGFVLLNAVLLISPLANLFAVSPLEMSQVFTIYGLALCPTILIQLKRIIVDSIQHNKNKL